MNPFDALKDSESTIDDKFKAKLKNQIFKGKSMKKTSNMAIFKQSLLRAPITAVAATGIIVIAGMGTYALQANRESSSRQKEITNNLEIPTNLSDVLSVEKIRTVALADAPTGMTVSSIELENEHGVVVYKVRYSDGSFRLYDAKTGEATQAAEVESNVPAGSFTAAITLQEARNIAAARRPGQTITKIELENEEGAVVYSVRFSDGGRVDVNATTGAVTRVENGKVSGSSTSTSSSDSSSSSSSDDSSDDSNDDSSGSDSGSGSGSSNSGSGSSGSSGGDDKSDDNDDNSGHN